MTDLAVNRAQGIPFQDAGEAFGIMVKRTALLLLAAGIAMTALQDHIDYAAQLALLKHLA
ncbi:MAG: hypothetical protein MSA20_04045 [Bacteroidales bacterium]|nr:hypothetical protein [Bacteroidales bacterium]